MPVKERIENLLGLLRKWHQDPAAMEVAPSVESAHLPWPLPPPQVSWTLFGLWRYRSRARFAVKAVSDHLLRDNAEKEMRAACLRTPAESRACGCLPGMPEWTYELDPWESLLKHQQTSECITFGMGRLTYFASDSLGKYFTTNRGLGAAERRVDELFPRGEGLIVALRRLKACRIVCEPDSDSNLVCMSVKLARSFRSYSKPVQAFWAAWQNPDRRLSLAAMIGDWPVVADLAQQQGQSELAAEAAVSAARCQRQWLTLVRHDADSGTYPDVLYALAHAGAEELPEYLEEGLMVDPQLNPYVLEIVDDDPSWVPKVRDRFRRTVANHEREFSKDLMARYLAKHGYPLDELLQGLLREPSAHGAAWLLALDYARDQLPSLLHLSQQTGDDETRRRAQAVLALLNKGDSDGELRAEMEKASKHDTAPYVGWGIRKFSGWDRLMDSEEALNKGDQ